MSEQTDDTVRTYERGPSDPIRFADGPGTMTSVHVDAPPSSVWDLVTDINLPAEFSEEFLGARWEDPDADVGVGSTFHGRNQHPAVGEWEVPCFVNAYVDQSTFGWVSVDLDNPGARWRFDLEPDGDGTLLTFTAVLGPGPSGTTMAIDAMPDREEKIILRRIAEVHANMKRTVEGVKARAETSS